MVSVVNQWGNSYGQGVTFTTVTSALQSCVVTLGAADNVGGGSGTATAGNWLFVIASWSQNTSIGNAHIGVGDDIHSWWREYPASGPNDAVRTSVSYTPNLARIPGYVYVAVDDSVTAINVLVVEVSGLGAWDTVAGTNTNFAAAATSLSLALGAPGAASFFIAGVGGDNTAATQTFAPAGYTTLHTLSQTNGTDHTDDNYLTSAYIASSSGSQSISAAAVTPENLSGFLLGVYTTGTNPIPANNNPNWPYLKFEAAFGGGFNTPNSELTWTDITNRLWHYDETTGIQFQLGQLQSTNLTMELDNYDNALASQNSSSAYYPDVTSGTPLRIRAAIGTIAGVTDNRWYVIQRNAQQWPEEIDEIYRRYSAATGTDVWAVLSATGGTPYRGEVLNDNPYAWWPCDDQLGASGAPPTALLNAAPGNSNALNVILSPNGGTAQLFEMKNGSAVGGVITDYLSVPVYTVAANQGWMYGDPQSTPASATAGSAITASPGSASWQTSGQAGSTGANGWFLSCNDASFPGLSGGITVEGWFNYVYLAGPVEINNGSSTSPLCMQPNTSMTLMTLTTASLPCAILQLDTSGHLNFITYNGSTPTSHAIYTTSDLRMENWFQVTAKMTTTTWTVYVNGGITAAVSGTATGMTSAWTWLVINGDMGAHGGGTTADIVHSANVSVSHVAVYPFQLPLWRVLSHYSAAITGFGLLPAPQTITSTLTETFVNASSTSGDAAPDGSIDSGSYNSFAGVSASVVVAAIAGSVTSGPSPEVSTAIYQPGSGGNTAFMWAGWTGVAPSFQVFTSANTGAETEASTVCGAGDSYSTGYGSGASGHGAGHTAGGSGAALPTSPTAIGDTAAQRMERVLQYGNVTYPGRCIDPTVLLVQAALDVGGQQAGQNIQNQAITDGGLLFIDNTGKLNYWSKAHLAAQYSSPVWNIGPTTGAGRTPYDRDIRWILDPQQAWNAIEIQPYSPAGASLPIITPANNSAVVTSQQQYGAQPYQVNSYLQSTSEMQSQANWLFTNFGQPNRRAENIIIDAASYPQAWTLVLGINVGDLVQLEDWQIGGGGTVYTMRVSNIKRTFSFGDDHRPTMARVELQVNPEPSSYWS